MKSSRRSLFRLLGVGAAGTALARFLPVVEAAPVAGFPLTPRLDALTKEALGRATSECCAIYLHRDHGALACGDRAGHAGPHRAVFAMPYGGAQFSTWGAGSLGRGSGPVYDYFTWFGSRKGTGLL